MTSSYFNFDGINESTLPSWEGSFDYEPSSGIFGSGAGSPKWGEALLAASKYLSQSKKKEEEEDKNEYRKQAAFGNSLQASISDGPDKYTKIYTPPTQAQVYLPGVQGKPGPLGTIAGAALGLAVPAIGPALGAQLGNAIGGAFG